jgi:hypothetical protein
MVTKFNEGTKNAEFDVDSKLLNKGLPQKKVRGPKTFAHSAERKKPTWFLLFYDNILLFRNFWRLFFNRQRISNKFCVFFTSILQFLGSILK